MNREEILYVCELGYVKGVPEYTLKLNNFFDVCESGDIVKVRELISKGANYWITGFKGACYGGHIEIVELMLQYDENNGEDIGECIFECGFLIACTFGRMNIVKLLLSKFFYRDLEIDFWESGLEAACKNIYGREYDKKGRCDIINLALSKGAKINSKLPKFPKEYTKYKQEQLLKFTKMHESLVTIIKM